VCVNKWDDAVNLLLTGEKVAHFVIKYRTLCIIIDAFIFTLETGLSRIINPDSAGKRRNRLTKAIVLAVRELALQTGPGTESRDLAAFIALALDIVAGTIDISVAAWEKRGYWVKADKFRMDWVWAGQLAEKMRLAVLADDWTGVTQVAAQIAGRLNRITVPVGHHLGRPWVGAWDELRKR
jgi:hypothetical protein